MHKGGKLEGWNPKEILGDKEVIKTEIHLMLYMKKMHKKKQWINMNLGRMKVHHDDKKEHGQREINYSKMGGRHI